MSFATLNDNSCTARVQVSDWGAWWADVNLTEPVALSGSVAFKFADVEAKGTIVSGGTIDGKAAYRVVGGKGGWGKTLKRKPYLNDAGVKASGVIGDAAREAGETVEGAPTNKLDSHFVRAEAPLHLLAPQAWRVDFDGVTRFGKRPVIAYTGDGTRVRVAPDARVIEIATEVVGQLLPGVMIDGSLPATDIEYEITTTRMTVRVYAGRATSRRLLALRRIVESLFPDLIWRGSYEFRVVSQEGNRFNLQPVRVGTGMPDLGLVPARGHAGVRATVTPGELVMVAFADADPSRPFIFAHDVIDSIGWMPLFIELGEEPTLGIARQTDSVVCGGFGGVITTASIRAKAGS